MSGIEHINYKYLGISVVFLILTYYYLNNTKNVIKKKDLDNAHKSSVKVMTSKGEIYMDPNVFEIHMNRLKENIIKIHKDFNKNDCPSLKNYLDKAKINTKKYIKMNTKNNKPKFCDLTHYDIFDDYIFQERELLKNKLSNKTERDDIESSDQLKYDLIELIIDMDIILFLIRSSLCKSGSVDLSALDQVVLELYRTNCMDGSNIDLSEKATKVESFKPCTDRICSINDPTTCYGEKNIYHDSKANTLLGLNPGHISRCVPSQDISDTETMHVKEILKQKRIDNNKSTLSHSDQKPFECNKVRLGKELAVSNYHRDSLQWFRELELRRSKGTLIDKNCRTCLAN